MRTVPRAPMNSVQAALLILALAPGAAHPQWPDTSTVFRQIVRYRWMNARQSPAFTPWTEDRIRLSFDSAQANAGGTLLYLTRRVPLDPRPTILRLRADRSGRVTPDTLTGVHSATAWDLIPSFHPSALVRGARWVDTVEVASTQHDLTTRLNGIRVSRLVRDTLVDGRRLWVVRDTLRGTYHEVATLSQRTQWMNVTLERNTAGTVTGEYVIEPDTRMVTARTDTALFSGSATIRYPDGRTYPTTTMLEQVRRIGGYTRPAYDSLLAEERRNAPRFSMFIEPNTERDRRLAGGDVALRDSLVEVLDQSRDVDERRWLLNMLTMWARGSGNQPFADTLRAHLLLAGDTALVVSGLLSPIETPLTLERLALLLPFVRDPAMAFAWGIPITHFHSNLGQRFTEYPPAIPLPAYRTLCTAEACAMLAALQGADEEPRLRQTARLVAFASDPLRWIDSVRDEPGPGGLYNLLHGVGATSRTSYPPMPAAGASPADWTFWMNGAALPDSVLTEDRAPVLVFGERHANASAFYGLLSGRDIPAEWEAGATQAGSALERFVFERMLAGTGRWHPSADSVTTWLTDGTPLGWTRGALGAPRALADAPLPDSATVTALIDRIVAERVDGEPVWEQGRPVPPPARGSGTVAPQPQSRRGWGGRDYTIYVVTPIVTEELRAKWGGRVTWITDPTWQVTEDAYPAVIISLSGLAGVGPLAKISVRVSSARKNGEYTDRSLSGASYILIRTPAGWRVVSGDTWVV